MIGWCLVLFREKQADLDDGGDAHQDVNDVRERRAGAEESGDEVELSDSDEAPVEPADDKQDAGDQIQRFHVFSFAPLSSVDS